jgi:hypothetical protein
VVVNSSCAIIRPVGESDYIVSYLRTITGKQDFLDKASKATSGTFIPRLSTADLADIEIPILPVVQLGLLGDAKIEQSSEEELLAIKKELESKNAEIERLRSDNETLIRFYENRLHAIKEQLAMNTLVDRISHGETASLEFKSSLRWNIRAQKFDKEIENAVLKTIVAFCNTSGGELLIGVDDEKSVIGVVQDGFPNNDKFQLHLRNLLIDRVVPAPTDLVEYEMINIEGKTICLVRCKQSKKKELWLKPDKGSPERFFVRFGPSSTELPPREAVAYIREHFEEGG